MNRKTIILLSAGILVASSGLFLLRDKPEPYQNQKESVANPMPDPAAVPAGPSAAEPGKDVFTQTRTWLGEVGVRDRATQDWVAEGKKILTARREVLASLIHSDPELALEMALTDAERAMVPGPLQHLLEETIRGVGDLNLVIACGGDHAPGEHPPSEMWREAQLSCRIFKAHVHGNRKMVMTISNVPLDGIAIEDQMAVADSPLQLVDTATDGKVRARFGAGFLTFPSRTAFDKAAEAVRAAERAHDGPVVTYPDLTSFNQP